MIIVLMGVSGCGKSTVGKLLAHRLGWQFLEGDDFHPATNIEKMAGGVPLSDSDRGPWFAKLTQAIRAVDSKESNAVVACSALRESYRIILQASAQTVQFVWLQGTSEGIAKRIASRKHFFSPALLQSQFETLEPPTSALEINIEKSPQEIVEQIIQHLIAN